MFYRILVYCLFLPLKKIIIPADVANDDSEDVENFDDYFTQMCNYRETPWR